MMFRNLLVSLVFAFIFIVDLANGIGADDLIGQACVKIHRTRSTPDYYYPWRKGSSTRSAASGVIIDVPRSGNVLAGIDGPLILTNAHVVGFASEIYVQFNQETDKHAATLVAIAPGIDLALLSVNDASEIPTYQALPLSDELPSVKDTVVSAYGFPIGGEQLSVTKGIVSRIEVAPTYFNTTCVRIQIDAALNPGNSGGPAIANGKIVGLAFSGMWDAENIGYLLSADEIREFLFDLEDGKYDGKPTLFDVFQSSENRALRERLGLDKGTTGVVVSQPYKESESYPLKRWDVVTHIGKHRLDNTGMVEVRTGLRLSFSKFVSELAKQGKVSLKVWRAGQELDIWVPVECERDDLIVPIKYDSPEYAILGPFVFTVPGRKMVVAICNSKKWVTHLIRHRSPLLGRLNDARTFPGEQLVLVPCPMFSHPISKGYDSPTIRILTHLNNQLVKNLAHLVELYHNATDDFLEFTFGGLSEAYVFRRTEFMRATEDILEAEGIRRQFSPRLRAVSNAETRR